MKIYETENLIIRPYKISDYNSWKTSNENRLPSQNKFDVGKVENLDKQYFYNFLSYLGEMKKNDKIYVYAIFDKITNEHIGVVEFTVLLRNGFDWGLYGTSIHNIYWGKGYGKEVTYKSFEIAKDLNILRLECDIEEDNVRSIKMVEKCGFEFEGIRKNFYNNGNEYINMNIYVKNLRS